MGRGKQGVSGSVTFPRLQGREQHLQIVDQKRGRQAVPRHEDLVAHHLVDQSVGEQRRLQGRQRLFDEAVVLLEQAFFPTQLLKENVASFFAPKMSLIAISPRLGGACGSFF